ncbi:MAG: 3-oxoacyl-ACP synthase III family protein [Myxococcales bacterium FL481]|nr:MAG: 3-oxoacyl-ACP synthase III family protein [Myxococcales bacterium FL481]
MPASAASHLRPVGILGIGTYLPPSIRTNDWWPTDVVERWRAGLAKKFGSMPSRESAPRGAQMVLDAMATLRDDPFQGARTRHVLEPGVPVSTMEVAAGRQALARADVRPDKIDLLICYCNVPDYLTVPNAPVVHQKLELPEACISFDVESACNSFATQMELAWRMIGSSAANYALLVQSNAVRAFCKTEDPFSAWFGDGATAVVVGPVSRDRGLLGTAHLTDGSCHDGLVGRSGPGEWHQGRVELSVKSKASVRKMLLEIPRMGDSLITRALSMAGMDRREIDFFACHQGTVWLRSVVAEYAGIESAKSFDCFPETTSLSAANIPYVLSVADSTGLLDDGDCVATYSGGSGITSSSLVLRWGR